jgi:hypothetical protein
MSHCRCRTADKATDVPDPARESAKTFEFTFATAGKIAKIIRGMKATEAMGIDDVPTLVLKKGVEVLAGPISHLVNRWLDEGRIPETFKIGKVFPIFKGKRKAREDPASYRPVSILPAMSKILETSVKADLKDHLPRVNGLPGAQYGFRPKRSCTSHTCTPGGSPAPRGGRLLASWPSTCPPPSILWRPSSSSQSSNR